MKQPWCDMREYHLFFTFPSIEKYEKRLTEKRLAVISCDFCKPFVVLYIGKIITCLFR